LRISSCVIDSASAFVQPSIVGKIAESASLNKAAAQQQAKVKDPNQPLYILPPEGITDIPYGEESRKFRRTVYTHDDWVKHRNPNRFFKNLRTTTTSGIYKVRSLCIGVAVLCCLLFVYYVLCYVVVDCLSLSFNQEKDKVFFVMSHFFTLKLTHHRHLSLFLVSIKCNMQIQ